MHHFVDGVVENDAKRIRVMREETGAGDLDPVRLGIIKKVDSDVVGRQGRAQRGFDCGHNVVFGKIGGDLRAGFFHAGTNFFFPVGFEMDALQRSERGLQVGAAGFVEFPSILIEVWRGLEVALHRGAIVNHVNQIFQ